jgi:hypothetical protein
VQIIWAEHDGNRIEELLGVMLCREFPHANRIRPSQGDGGIDVIVPVGDGQVDIYQVKGFTASLTASQKAQVKKSLQRIGENHHVQVRDWYLTVPVNPTQELKFDWFESLGADCEFECHWFGLDQCVGLAATYPEVSRYYLGDGGHRLEQALANLRAISELPLSGKTEGQLVSLEDLAAPFSAATAAVNGDDPHYRYELMVTKHMPYSLSALPPPQPDGLDAAAVVSQRVDENTVFSVLVFPRYAEAPVDRPITGSFQIPSDKSGMPHDEAAARFLEFGTDATFKVRNLTADLPGGLSLSAMEGLIHVAPISARGTYELRLVAVDAAGKASAECVCLMQPASTGVGAVRGIYAHGASEHGLFDIEIPARLDTSSLSIIFHLNAIAGREPAAIAAEMWLLHALSSATALRVGPRHGPLLDAGNLPPDGLPAMFDERLLRLVDDMALIQRERCAELRIPEFGDFEPATVRAIRIAAALLRGGGVRTDYTEQRFTMPLEHAASIRGQLGVPVTVETQGSWRQQLFGHIITIEPVDMLLRSAILAVDEDDDSLFIATPGENSEMLIQPHAGSVALTQARHGDA